MANGVLPFVRGVDFATNDFKQLPFPEEVADMVNLRWLNVDSCKLDHVPSILKYLKKLERVSINRNHLMELGEEFTKLKELRVVTARHNNITNNGLSGKLFELDELTTVDLSYNELTEVPHTLGIARQLLVLSISHNKISTIPGQIFVNLADLFYLDLSNNSLELIPPQLRRLINVQTLNISHNPLGHSQLRQLASLTSLQSLNLRDTQRNNENMPNGLQHLPLLEVPGSVYEIATLKRCNISYNRLIEIPESLDAWSNLLILNLSRNELKSLPIGIESLVKLKRFYLNGNQLTYDGLPDKFSKMTELEIFSASNNKLVAVPPTLFRCLKLTKVILRNNGLLTIPDGVYYLPDLETLDVAGNPELKMPTKPNVKGQKRAEFYNVDFSLAHQLKVIGAAPKSAGSKDSHREHIAKKARIQNRRAKPDEGSNKILKALADIPKDKENESPSLQDEEEGEVKVLKPRSWVDQLSKPDIDYSEIFPADTGQDEGITIWQIENFLPVQIDEVMHGKFYDADCYIILKTLYDVFDSLDWEIYYWIGKHSTLDKKACSAIHAVNLRNLLGAQCRTAREEMEDESDEFLAVFNHDIDYIEGGTASGFFTVEEVIFERKMYRLVVTSSKVCLERVDVCVSSLDPKCTFILDTGKHLYIWHGKTAPSIHISKAKLFADKLNKSDKKGRLEVTIFEQRIGEESEDFWSILGGSAEDAIEPHVGEFELPKPILYKVELGKGYLELPQVKSKRNLEKSLLDKKDVYILDCFSDLFIWIGRQSSRLIRAAAIKLAHNMLDLFGRPSFVSASRVLEGAENMIFKNKFSGWDDVLYSDFTKVKPGSTSKAQTSKHKLNEDIFESDTKDGIKTDLACIFSKRQSPMPEEEADQLMDDYNDELDYMQSFVLEGKKFIKLSDSEIGHFYDGDCYVFLCRYWFPKDIDEEEENQTDAEDGDTPYESIYEVYFWQGRFAQNMGWLTFTFSLKKKFETLLGKIEVTRIYQQQESYRFLSHFKRRFIIHHGHRLERQQITNEPCRLYHIRANGCSLTKRTVEVQSKARKLNAEFCYILKAPSSAFNSDEDDTAAENQSDHAGVIYIWAGRKCLESETEGIDELVECLNVNDSYEMRLIHEGHEPEEFWAALGGKAAYDQDADFLRYSRLFRCSNDRGFFKISEKCLDFCQNDLAIDDAFILDTGHEVFVWAGSEASEIEVKLSLKSAQLYIQNLKDSGATPIRKLHFARKGKEPHKFTRCFHGWRKFEN